MALLTNINGKFSVSDVGAVTFNNAFTFPTADGAANYVLQTNGSGQLAWALNGNGDISGSGTANTVTKFTGSGTGVKTIGNGPITFSSNDSTFAGTVETTKVRSDIMNNKADTANIIYRSGTDTIIGNNANALVVEDGGNVGIGTASPNEKLEVAGNVGVNGFITHNGDSGTFMGWSANDTNVFYTAGNERMRIDSSGDVTIQGGRIYLKESDLGNTAIALTRDADEGYVQLFSSGTQTVEIRGNGNSYFNGGNVLIGSSSAAAGVLVVDGNSANNIWVVGRDSDGTGSLSFRNAADNAYNARLEAVSGALKVETNGTLALTIDSSQNAIFAVTVTAPTFSGDLNGTINTVTTATTKGNSTNDTTVATTAFVQNVIGTIPAGLVFQGTWNASTNSPTLTSGSGTTGNFYIVSVAGSTNLDGITDWQVGDWAVFIEQGASDQWEKIDNSSVLSGSGTGGSFAGWSGSGTSVTLGNAPVTFSGNNSTFANDIFVPQNKGIFFNGASDFSSGIAGTSAGQGVRIFAGGSAKVTIDSSGNSIFAGSVTTGTSLTVGTTALVNDTLYLAEYIQHIGDTNNNIRFQAGRMILQSKASGSAKIDLHDNGSLYLNSGGGTALTLDTSQNATFAGSITSQGIGATSLTTPLIQLQGNITILNKAQTSYISFATRDTSGSDTIMDLTNVTINGGDPGPYLPLSGGTLTGNLNFNNSVRELKWDHTSGQSGSRAYGFIGEQGAYGRFALRSSNAADNVLDTDVLVFNNDLSATFAGKIICNNVGNDRKIEFNRTGANVYSIEHDSAFLYFYNVTANSIPLKLANNNDATFAGDVSSSGTSKSLKYWRRLWTDANNDWGLNNNAGTGVISVSGMGTPSTSTTTFAGNVMLDVNNWLQGHVTVGGGTQSLIRSRAMGYPGYYGCQVGEENNHIALFIDPLSVAGGSFSGNANELMLPNKVIFQQANAVSNPTNWLNGQSITLDNGKVGIGTSTPGSKLTINETSTATAAVNIVTARYGISLQGAGATSNSQYLLNLQSDGGAKEVMRVQSSGNVGIGTTSPASVLHIKDNTAGPTQLSIQSNDFTRAEEINFLNPSTSAISGQIKYYTNPTVEYMSFSTSNNSAAVERIRINADGTTKFNANILVDVINNSANSANIIYRSGTSTLVGGGTTANKLYVLDNGSVGIGTTTPGAKLEVKVGSAFSLHAGNACGNVGIGVTSTDISGNGLQPQLTVKGNISYGYNNYSSVANTWSNALNFSGYPAGLYQVNICKQSNASAYIIAQVKWSGTAGTVINTVTSFQYGITFSGTQLQSIINTTTDTSISVQCLVTYEFCLP